MVEVDPLDDGVDGGHQVLAAAGPEQRGVVAGPEPHPPAAGRQRRDQRVDELELAEGTGRARHGLGAGSTGWTGVSGVTSGSGRSWTGSTRLKVEPCPGVDTTRTSPPWASTKLLTMASPSPAPPYSRVVVPSTW